MSSENRRSSRPDAPDALGTPAGWEWETDRHGFYTACSPEVAVLLGVPPSVLLGQPLTFVALPADGPARRELNTALNNQRPILDVRLLAQHGDGRQVSVVLNALPKFDEAGDFAGYRGVAQVMVDAPPVAPHVSRTPTEPLPPAPRPKTQPLAAAPRPTPDGIKPTEQFPVAKPAAPPTPPEPRRKTEPLATGPAAPAASATPPRTPPVPSALAATRMLRPAEQPAPPTVSPSRPTPAPTEPGQGEASAETSTPSPNAAPHGQVPLPPAPWSEIPPIAAPAKAEPAKAEPGAAGEPEPSAPAPWSGRTATRWGYVATESGLAPLGDWATTEGAQALAEGRLVVTSQSSAEPPASGSGPNRPGRALSAPIRLQNEIIGVLDFVDEAEAAGWTEDDLALVQAVSDQLALALENARLFSETRDYLNKQTLLYEVTRAAASAASLGEALNNAAEAVGRALPDADIAIMLLDEDRQRLRIRAAVGFPADLRERLSVRLGEGITGWVAQHNQAVLLADVRQDPRYVPGLSGMAAEAAVPLALGERVIGVLNVESPQVGAFDEQDLQLLSTLAGTLSAIIVNNNLLAEISQERERLGVLYDVLQGLITRPEREAILNTALAMAPRLGAQHAYILLLGQRDAEATFRSTLPGLDHLDERQAQRFALTIAKQGLEQWVLTNHRPAVVTDTAVDKRWYTDPSHTAQEPARAVISVPLQTQRGALSGVLAYTHGQPGALGHEQLPLMENIAGQVAVALENELLRQQQRAQSSHAEALARAAQAMTRTLDEAELHQIVVAQVFEAFQPNGAVLLQWEPVSNTFLPVALHVASKEAPADRDAWPVVGERIEAGKRPDLVEVIYTRQGRVSHLRDVPGGQVRERMVLPLLYGGDVDGVLEVVHTGPMHGLAQADVELFQSILTAAASALQSARLYALQRQTAERLAEVDRLKSQFLANMSHELRTPLNSIIGFSRVILKGIDGPLTELQVQDLGSINNAGQHLLGLINDILDMARIEAGKMELVLDEMDLHDTIKGVMSTMVALVKDKPVRLVEDLAGGLPRVHADGMRVRQVLLNLLSNAAKFTDQGSITLRARPVDSVSPQSGRLEPYVEISVIDTGPGIAPEDMAKLFEPFSQVDASATRKMGGTGLGLSICRQLVELHNGRIWAESELGRGSTFIFTLPVSRKDTVAAVPAPAEGLRPTTGYLSKIVLAVDDDQGIPNLYRRYLEPHGFQVVGVSKSSEAITRAAELRPVAVLLDVLMPNRDGWQVLADLKRSPVTRDIPVIMCTLVTDPERARAMGAADYLNKPILEGDLVRALGRLPQPAPGGAQQAPAVLVIDDRGEDIAFVRRALDPSGQGQTYRVLEARTGLAGLAAARLYHPQAIILDLLLPEMNGFEVLTALRNDPETRSIPVIVVSGAELSSQDRDRLSRNVAALRSKGALQQEELLHDLQRALG
ncbi:MAG: GAF domain-containing protein [Anaerolineales bacterium]|nr:GAF domain-containing protein [Anaerolineales bacterium]